MLNGTQIVTTNADVHYFVFPFEDSFRHQSSVHFFQHYWLLPFGIVAAYIALLFAGRRFMSTRPRYELRLPLFLWNLFLAVATIVTLFRSVPQMVYTVRRFGLHYSVCGPIDPDFCSATYLWQLTFISSKVVELVDTVFVVLRRQPLFFLHWYHHSTVLLYCWYAYAEQVPSGRWFALINASVHAIMYSYYSLKSLSIHVPRHVAMSITVVQLLQMVAGCYINYYVDWAKRNGVPCAVSDDNMRVSMLMYASYFVLFLWYFYKAYFSRRSLPSTESNKENGYHKKNL